MSNADSGAPTGAARKRVIFVNRYFAPDLSATSQILSDLAFHLAGSGRDVHVVCGDTLYASAVTGLPRAEILNGVSVHRVQGGRFGRSGLAGRAADYLDLYLSLRSKVSRVARPGDVVIAKTDPPLLTNPLAGLVKQRGAVFLPWLQDLYPEVAIALGVPFIKGPAGRAMTALRDASLRKADGIVAIGARMQGGLVARGMDREKIHVIANWSDENDVQPVARSENGLRDQWGLGDKFVVGYSGNLGRAHEFGTLVEAAQHFRGRNDIAFLFIGGGHHVEALKKEAQSHGIADLFHFQPYQDRQFLSQSLSAPDVHWLSLRPELEGLIVPSKFYGIAAAGRGVINVGAHDGEVAALVAKFHCGVTVQPGDGDRMAAVISDCMTSPSQVQVMGENGRRMLVDHFSRTCAMAQWEKVLEPYLDT